MVCFDCVKGRGISRCLAKSGHNIILTYNSNIDAANENKLFIEENYSERVFKGSFSFSKTRLKVDIYSIHSDPCQSIESVKCAVVQADFINKNKESVAAIFDTIKQNTDFQKSFVGFIHNAGGYRHPPQARPSIEFAQE